MEPPHLGDSYFWPSEPEVAHACKFGKKTRLVGGRRGQDGNKKKTYQAWHILLRKSPSTTTSQHRPHTGCRELHGKLYRGSNEHQKVRSTNEDEVILGGYAAWQEVVASRDIQVGERVMIACGTSGIVLCNHETTHIKVVG
eukprot:symbB.v1.2.021198.t1/scaffold1819.1/size114121/7